MPKIHISVFCPKGDDDKCHTLGADDADVLRQHVSSYDSNSRVRLVGVVRPDKKLH
jgi:hypothetical protein